MSEAEIRALEERLAREVMGWEYGVDFMLYGDGVYVASADKRTVRGTWSPWTSANDALEAMRKTGEEWLMGWSPEDGAHCQKPENRGRWPAPSLAPTLPEAICKALEAWLDAKS